MCLTCGCDEPYKKHNDKHLAAQDVVLAARANDAGTKETAETFKQGMNKMTDEDWKKAEQYTDEGKMEEEGGFSTQTTT